MLKVRWSTSLEDSKRIALEMDTARPGEEAGLCGRETGYRSIRPCPEPRLPGKLCCARHPTVAEEPDLKRQAKAREALRKLTKGMTRTVLEDGTEVYE